MQPANRIFCILYNLYFAKCNKFIFYKGQRKGQGQDTDPDQDQREGQQSLYY